MTSMKNRSLKILAAIVGIATAAKPAIVQAHTLTLTTASFVQLAVGSICDLILTSDATAWTTGTNTAPLTLTGPSVASPGITAQFVTEDTNRGDNGGGQSSQGDFVVYTGDKPGTLVITDTVNACTLNVQVYSTPTAHPQTGRSCSVMGGIGSISAPTLAITGGGSGGDTALSYVVTYNTSGGGQTWGPPTPAAMIESGGTAPFKINPSAGANTTGGGQLPLTAQNTYWASSKVPIGTYEVATILGAPNSSGSFAFGSGNSVTATIPAPGGAATANLWRCITLTDTGYTLVAKQVSPSGGSFSFVDTGSSTTGLTYPSGDTTTVGSDANGGLFSSTYGGTNYTDQATAQASGTVTSSGTTVTATTGIFTAAMVGNAITDGTVYPIITGYTSSTVVTVSSAPSWSSASVKVGGALASLYKASVIVASGDAITLNPTNSNTAYFFYETSGTQVNLNSNSGVNLTSGGDRYSAEIFDTYGIKHNQSTHVSIVPSSSSDISNISIFGAIYAQIPFGAGSADTAFADLNVRNCDIRGFTNAFRSQAAGSSANIYDSFLQSGHGTSGMLGGGVVNAFRCRFDATGKFPLSGGFTVPIQMQQGYLMLRDSSVLAEFDTFDPSNWVASAFLIDSTSTSCGAMFINSKLYGNNVDVNPSSGTASVTFLDFINTPLDPNKNPGVTSLPAYESIDDGTYVPDPQISGSAPIIIYNNH